jgi:hypothetical protein
MRIVLIFTGWALALAALGLLAVGIAAAAPGTLDSTMSAARQVAAQNWSLARGFEALALAGLAQIGAMGAFILAQMLPTPPGHGQADWQGDVARIARAIEAQRREGGGRG